MRPRQPTIDQVRQLPSLMQHTIPSEWEDCNGHVNIQFYLTLYERGGWPLVAQLGMDEAYFRDRRHGLFDLEHHLFYLSELHVGDQVGIHARLIDRTEKRFHGFMFIVNDSREVLSSSLEFVTSGANLEERRTAAFPEDIAEQLDRMIESHRRLTWTPPLCGVMSA